MVLTQRQRVELYRFFAFSIVQDLPRHKCLSRRRNKAILDYLETSGFTKTCAALVEEGSVEKDNAVSGLLEKKWSSVVRLQKKVRWLRPGLHLVSLPTNSHQGYGAGRPSGRSSRQLERLQPGLAEEGWHRGTASASAGEVYT